MERISAPESTHDVTDSSQGSSASEAAKVDSLHEISHEVMARFGLMAQILRERNEGLAVQLEKLGRHIGLRPEELLTTIATMQTVVLAQEAEIGDAKRALADSNWRRMEAEAERDAAHKEAREDPLTGLPNRRGFTERFDVLAQSFYGARRERDMNSEHACLCVMGIDLDGFKGVNDTLGHPAGDVYLQTAASEMRDAFKRVFRRGDDLIGRLGGDEFAVAFEAQNEEVAREMAEKLREAVAVASNKARESLKLKDNSHGHISASIGYVLVRQKPQAGRDQYEGPLTPDELLKRADYAMYVAKETGKNRVVSHEEAEDLDKDGAIAAKRAREKGEVFMPARG